MIAKLLFLSILGASVALPTIYTFEEAFLLPLTVGIWIVNIVGFILFGNLLIVSRRLKKRVPKIQPFKKPLSVAAVVTVYNEDPAIVEETLQSVKLAVEYYGLGDTFLLDDSEDPGLANRYREICRKLGVGYVRRGSREGYKAGNLNNFLRLYGRRYDLLAVFDADQRPMRKFFSQLIPYFSDERVGYVYTPQAYTVVDSAVAEGASAQQKPFYYLILPGFTSFSRFSIGSGVIYRIDVLEAVGGFDESNVCEDVATSIRINELGYIGIYVETPLVYYGIPPRDVSSYVRQQGRWSLGYFQLLKKIITCRLRFPSFLDYFTAYLYWLRVGPLKIIEIAAPVFFLLTGISFIRLDPLAYMTTYIPYFAVTLLLFITLSYGVARYGVKDFIYHQGVENLAFWEVTKSFIYNLFGRNRGFVVTSKKRVEGGWRSILPHLIAISLLILAIEVGIYKIFFTPQPQVTIMAEVVNIFWAAYLLFFQVAGLLLVNRDVQPVFLIPAFNPPTSSP